MKRYVVWRKYEFIAGDRWIDAVHVWDNMKNNLQDEKVLVMESPVREAEPLETGLKAWFKDTLKQLTGGRL